MATTQVDAATETEVDAATKVETATFSPATTVTTNEEELQSRLAAPSNQNSISLTFLILGFVGVVWIFVTLFKIPPLTQTLNHQMFISFAVGGALGILLNLLVILMHFLLRINATKLKKTNPPPSQELIEKCLRTHNKIDTAIRNIEKCGFVLGFFCWIWFLAFAIAAIFIFYHQDPKCLAFGVSNFKLHVFQAGAASWYLFWFLFKPLSATIISLVSRFVV